MGVQFYLGIEMGGRETLYWGDPFLLIDKKGGGGRGNQDRKQQGKGGKEGKRRDPLLKKEKNEKFGGASREGD